MNRVVVSGISEARALTADSVIRSKLRRLGAAFEGVQPTPLHAQALARARSAIDRMSRIYGPVLDIIEIIHCGSAISLDADDARLQVDGFLYDMNRFFHALLGRFLRESLPDWHVREEVSLSRFMRYSQDANPHSRSAPRPRPDFAVSRSRASPPLFLDAKYRDLWNLELPPSMLYQLAIYALSQQGQSSAAILYPAEGPIPRESVIEITDPISNETRATVNLRPVNLAELDQLVQGDDARSVGLREAWATRLVSGTLTGAA